MNFGKLKISKLVENNGQIEGVPRNPRQWSKEDVEKLKTSIQETPELLEARGCIVYPMGDKYVVLGGNMRLTACKQLGYKEVDCAILDEGTTPDKLREIVIKDNGSFGQWDFDMLANEWDDLPLGDWGVPMNDEKIEKPEEAEVVEDDFDEEKEDIPARCKMGDIWQLGDHRLMCGDSTNEEQVSKLMGGGLADLVFTDPPYGMGKESEGVLNDNLNYSDLLEFNKKWIPISFANLTAVGSWYCWGIDEPLMDIYSEILKPMTKQRGDAKLRFCNLITWDKGEGGIGCASPLLRKYVPHEEKCLFAMRGRQDYGGTKDDYWNGFDPLRLKFAEERKKTGLSIDELCKLAGGTSITHWWSESQWNFPNEERYKALQRALRNNGHDGFRQEYDGFRQEYDEIRQEYDEIRQEWRKTRGYFDNAHDKMTSVWRFSVTSQQERKLCGGHATPKPIALCSRGIKTSSKPGGIVLDLFGGSGSTLIACEQCGRSARLMELDPHYCDVIIARWEKLTGKTAIKL